MSLSTSTYARRLGAHHFAHLRAVAEGLSVVDAAQRYLAVEHGHQAASTHRQLVDQLRSLARRRGDRAWRLVGLQIQVHQGRDRPSLEDFIADRALDGWSESEVLELYQEAWPADPKLGRRQRLRDRQLALLRDLEQAAAERARPTDPLDGWLDPLDAQRLARAGFQTLADLHRAISRGGPWWQRAPAIGPIKAARLASLLDSLIPIAQRPDFGAPKAPPDAVSGQFPHEIRPLRTPSEATISPWQGTGGLGGEKSPKQPDSRPGVDCLNIEQIDTWSATPDRDRDDKFAPLSPEAQTAPSTDSKASQAAPRSLTDDLTWMERWAQERATRAATLRSYRREVTRWCLFLHHERGRSLMTAESADAQAFLKCLSDPPETWISRRRAPALAPGWSPLRGPLKAASRDQAAAVLRAFHRWLTDEGLGTGPNPWRNAAKGTEIGEAKGHRGGAAQRVVSSLGADPWEALDGHLQQAAPSPSRHRMVFVLRFLTSTGLRASELVTARWADVVHDADGWWLQIGASGLRVALPSTAMAALERYLAQRGFEGFGALPATLPLVDDLAASGRGIGYQALYQTVKTWLRRAVHPAALGERAEPHPTLPSPKALRDRFGLKATAGGLAWPELQQQLGQMDVGRWAPLAGRAAAHKGGLPLAIENALLTTAGLEHAGAPTAVERFNTAAAALARMD